MDSIFCLIAYPTLIALATLRRCDQDTVLTDRRTYTVETRQVSSEVVPPNRLTRAKKSLEESVIIASPYTGTDEIANQAFSMDQGNLAYIITRGNFYEVHPQNTAFFG